MFISLVTCLYVWKRRLEGEATSKQVKAKCSPVICSLATMNGTLDTHHSMVPPNPPPTQAVMNIHFVHYGKACEMFQLQKTHKYGLAPINIDAPESCMM